MLKFNFANLNNRLKNQSENSCQKNCEGAKTAEIQEQSPQYVCQKPKYSAYRTVVARHEQFAARIRDRADEPDGLENCDNGSNCDNCNDCDCQENIDQQTKKQDHGLR